MQREDGSWLMDGLIPVPELKDRLGRLYIEKGHKFAVSNEGRSLFKFLIGRGRIGRRFAPRFWETESTVGRGRTLMMVTCKKWHVAKRMVDRVRKVTNLPALDYLFNEGSTPLPDLGGIQSNLEKRTRHRRALVRMLGEGGWLRHSGAGEGERLDVRTLCLIRETLARHDGLADFAFAMQGLGMGAVTLFGTPAQKEWLTRTRAGAAISAFALTEPGSGSDVAATSTTATRVQGGWLIEGEKTWISNGGIADVYVLFARTGEAPGAKGLSAFLMPATVAGLEVAERLEVIAPHPLARLRMQGVVLPPEALIGTPGDGFKIAMSVLDVFRSTVGAAALGFARRALDEAVARVKARRIQGEPLSGLQMVQGHLADMALKIDAAALLSMASGVIVVLMLLLASMVLFLVCQKSRDGND